MNLQELGLQEMSTSELTETNGGIAPVVAGLIVAGIVIAGAGSGLLTVYGHNWA